MKHHARISGLVRLWMAQQYARGWKPSDIGRQCQLTGRQVRRILQADGVMLRTQRRRPLTMTPPRGGIAHAEADRRAA